MTAVGARPYTQFSRLTAVALGSWETISVRFVNVTLETAGIGHSDPSPPSQTSVLVSSDVFTMLACVSMEFAGVSAFGICSLCDACVLVFSCCVLFGSLAVSSVDVASTGVVDCAVSSFCTLSKSLA